ncbi:MAG: GDP-mannose 4,6-dehydratase [Phycisphaerales bacterium]
MPPHQPLLVTGAAGFIGSHVVDALLARGERVVGLDNFDAFYPRAIKLKNIQPALSCDRFTLIEADIRDQAALSESFAVHQPRAVFHLAALAGVRPSVEAPQRFADVNINGLVALLDAARAVACRKIIFASSSSVYGNNRKVPFAEDDAVDHPISPYAATKRAGELLCYTYAHLFEMQIACLRFFTVYGPRQRPDLAIARFMHAIANEQPIHMFGDGSSSRDYTYIDDILRGVLAAHDRIEDPALEGFRIWNLGGSSPISLKQMIAAVEHVVGHKARVEQLPQQPGDVERTFADVTRARAELGLMETVAFAEGLQKQWAARTT